MEGVLAGYNTRVCSLPKNKVTSIRVTTITKGIWARRILAKHQKAKTSASCQRCNWVLNNTLTPQLWSNSSPTNLLVSWWVRHLVSPSIHQVSSASNLVYVLSMRTAAPSLSTPWQSWATHQAPLWQGVMDGGSLRTARALHGEWMDSSIFVFH